MKDTGTSVGAVWDRLFKKPSRKKGGGNPEDKYVNRIVRDVQTCGEYEKISQGTFDRPLPFETDGVMQDALRIIWARNRCLMDGLGSQRCTTGCTSTIDSTDGSRRSRTTSCWAMCPMPLCRGTSSSRAVRIAQSSSPKWTTRSVSPTFLRADVADAVQAYLRRTAHQEIADAFALGIPHSLKNMFTGKTIASELLPFINRIIAPDLKPVNSQLIKTEERVVLLKLINSLLSMKLAFVQDKNEEGQLLYKIEPCVPAPPVYWN